MSRVRAAEAALAGSDIIRSTTASRTWFAPVDPPTSDRDVIETVKAFYEENGVPKL